ncbi:helix-turn-helix domain-containing protein, partial [Pseudomonas viridiflava]|uniref:helix-turn-helix transcriptional regulator n=1 Tax=Pseudomonas viridiflava TaxID=33069 RepID=UPI0019D2441C
MIYIKYLNGFCVLYVDHFLTNSLRFTRLSSCLYVVTLMARSYSSNTLDALKVMAQLIHLARKKKGLTAQALADKAGVSRGLIHRIERAD